MKHILLILTLLITTLNFHAQDLKLGLPTGHELPIKCAFFSEDGKYVLTGAADSKAAIWDIETGKVIQKFEGHTGCVHDLKFDTEKNQFHSASCDSTIKVWDVNSGAILKDFKYNGQNLDFEFDYEHRYQLFRYDSVTWAVRDLDSDKIRYKIAYNSFDAPSLSPTRKYVILNYRDSVCIRNFKTGELFKKIKKKKAHIVFNKDESHFVVRTKKQLSIYAGKTGVFLKKFDNKSLTSDMFSPDGKSFITAIDSKVTIWHTLKMEVIHNLPPFNSEIYTAAFIADRRVFIVDKNGTAKLYDLDLNAFIWSQKDYLYQYLRRPDVLQYLGNEIDAWYKDSSSINFKKFHWSTLSLLPEYGKDQFFTYSETGISSWSTKTGDFMYQIEEKSNFGFSKKFDLALSFYEDSNTVNIWDISSGELKIQLSSRTKENNTLRIYNTSNQGDVILSAFGSNQLKQISLKNGQLLEQYTPHSESLEDLIVHNGVILSRSNHEVHLTNNKSLEPFFRHENKSPIRNAGFVKIKKRQNNLWIAGENYTAVWRKWDWLRNGKPYTIKTNLTNFSKPSLIQQIFVYNAPRISKFLTLYETLESIDYDVYDYQLNLIDGDLEGEFYMNYYGDYWKDSWISQYAKFPNFFTSAAFGPNPKYILTTTSCDYGLCEDIAIYDIEKYQDMPVRTFKGHTAPINRAEYHGNKHIISSSMDKTVRYWDIPVKDTNSHKSTKIFKCPSFPMQTDISNDSKYVITSCLDGSIFVWDFELEEPLIQMYIFDNDPKKWLHLHPSGLFDASPEAMDLMYWTKGLEVIEFSQLKDRYWLPGLWEKVMSGKELPKVKSMQELKLYPKVAIKSSDENTITVDLTKRDGGYGAVKVLLNGKEISQDARGANFDASKDYQTLEIDIKDHPYLKEGENKITVIAASENGINSRGVDNIIQITKKEQKQPQFFAVVVGINEYANDNINLKFPVADAKAISKAVSLGAQNLFKDLSHVYTLTSDGDKRPSKDNLKAVFEDIAKKASSEDIIFLYLAGHGISTSGDEGDFYFLTADAMSANQEAYEDEQIRNSTTISTNEWVEWFKEIPALKQVMILDACGSGKAVDNLIAERDIEPSQRKAMDRMKDRTGMYVISGCAADAVSYEASQYGQGLLTYSLLQGMKGAALKEDQYVDVSTILNHARESVPQLAKGIGGIQTPQLLQPKSGSFDIGILKDQDREKINISEPKQVYIRSVLVDKKKYRDVLGISSLLNDKLNVISSRGVDAGIVYFDTEDYGNSCQITGGYENNEQGLSLSMTTICEGIETEYQIEAKDKEELIDKIIQTLNLER